MNSGNGPEQGEAEIALVVDEKGHVARAQIAKSSGSDVFDQSAVKAAKHYTFEPATLNGEPVAVQMNIAMNFTSRRRR